MSTNHSKVNAQNDAEILSKISAAVLSIQRESGYGSIEITIHDGKVTQIERREKFRFQPQANKLLNESPSEKNSG